MSICAIYRITIIFAKRLTKFINRDVISAKSFTNTTLQYLGCHFKI